MDKKWFVGIDLGGTITKIAIVDEDGNVIKKWEIDTDTSEEGSHITLNIAASLEEQLAKLSFTKDRISAIGIGAPGFIELSTGFVYRAVNLGWRDYALKDHLEETTGILATVDNDANIYAIGEMWKGAGDNASNLLCVTLGTGVGGGIITNGQILHGVNGMAGEIGHITAIPEGGSACNCGKTGCIETIASATGIARIATEGLSKHPDSQLAAVFQSHGRITAKDVFAAAEKEDRLALSVVDFVTFHLGLVTANLANALNPEKIVIGGGVSKAGNTLLEPLQAHFAKFALPRVAEGADFVIAKLGNDAGVIGAAWIARQALLEKKEQ